MIQLLLLLISFSYGLITGFIYFFINNIIKNKSLYYNFLILTYFIIITLGYIILFFILYNGQIHLYLKLILILGFIFSDKVSNLCKKLYKQVFKN